VKERISDERLASLRKQAAYGDLRGHEAQELLAEIDRLKTGETQWRALGRQVRIAACGPNHSMGSRFRELMSIVEARDDAQQIVEKWKSYESRIRTALSNPDVSSRGDFDELDNIVTEMVEPMFGKQVNISIRSMYPGTSPHGSLQWAKPSPLRPDLFPTCFKLDCRDRAITWEVGAGETFPSALCGAHATDPSHPKNEHGEPISHEVVGE
jgi:hypothetical protein